MAFPNRARGDQDQKGDPQTDTQDPCLFPSCLSSLSLFLLTFPMCFLEAKGFGLEEEGKLLW
jgi:hypothetical protein